MTHIRRSAYSKTYTALILCFLLFGICLSLVTFPAFADEPSQTAPGSTDQQTVDTTSKQDNVPVLTTGDNGAETPDTQTPATQEPILAEGTYIIQSTLPNRAMIDVAGGSKKQGGNVWLYGYNKTPAQRWKLTLDEAGFYTIANEKSGMVLDVSFGKMANKQNIWQYPKNNTLAQKWRIEKDGNGFVIKSAKDERFVLDAASGKSTNKTNVQLYRANKTAAQRWWIIPEKTKVVSRQTISDGIYEIAFAKDTKYALDLAAQSFTNGAKIQLYKRNNTIAQRWAITWEKDGYYSLYNVSSGKALDITSGAQAARTIVQQYVGNNTDAQRWAIVPQSDGSYTLVSKLNGLALDVYNASASNGARIQTYIYAGGASQKLKLIACDVLPEDTYTLYSLLSPTAQVLDVPAGSKTSATQLQLYKTNNTMAQKYLFRRLGANTYAIQNVYSGSYVEDMGGKIVQQKRASADSAQHWVASFERNGVSLTNKETGKRLSVAGSKSANKTKVISDTAKNTNAQHWRLRGVSQLIPNATYTITNAKGMVVDVTSASVANGANIQVYKSNNTGAQKFDIALVGGGYYKIVNSASGKAVEVKDGSKANGANVDQASYSGATRQLWKPTLREDGYLTFVNKASGKALDVAGGSSSSGANVQSYTTNGTQAQGWALTATKYVPPAPAMKQVRYASFDHGPKPAANQKYIMLHDTEGLASPANIAHQWAASNGGAVAAHFVVGRDGTIVQCVDINRIAHHAGFGGPGNYDARFGVGKNDGRGNGDDLKGVQRLAGYTSYGMNSYSIGIEMVHVTGMDYPEAQLKAVDKLIAYLDGYFGFKATIIDHKMWRPSNSDTDRNFAPYLKNYRTRRTH